MTEIWSCRSAAVVALAVHVVCVLWVPVR
jgi:hypothetical protein